MFYNSSHPHASAGNITHSIGLRILYLLPGGGDLTAWFLLYIAHLSKLQFAKMQKITIIISLVLKTAAKLMHIMIYFLPDTV